MDSIAIQTLVKKQRAFFSTQQTFSPAFRKEYLKKLKKEIQARHDDILKALENDLGKHKTEALLSELFSVFKDLNFMIKNVEKFSKKRKSFAPLMLFPAKTYVEPEPYGCTLIISPWNYPFLLSILPLVGAVAAGNCAIVKTSEMSVHTSEIIHEIVSNVFPEEYVCVVQGDAKEAQILLAERFDFILYTGNTRVGKIVMEAASKNLTPVCLELGGKSPTIVLDDANIKLAAKRIVFGKFFNAGQTCVAPDYILAHTKIKTQLMETLQETMTEFIGENQLLNPQYARIINKKHMDRIIALAGDYPVKYDETSLKMAMTLIDAPHISSPIMQEEIFGPLLPVLEVQGYEEAFQFVREREKPLAAYLFTENKGVQERFSKYVSAGGLCINDTILHVGPHLPFGGVGMSGMGKYMGRASFEIFSHAKPVLHKSTRCDMRLRYPPYPQSLPKFLMKIFFESST